MKLLQVTLVTIVTALSASAADVVLLSPGSNPAPLLSSVVPGFTNSPPVLTNTAPGFANPRPVTNKPTVTNLYHTPPGSPTVTNIIETKRMTPSWTNQTSVLVTNGTIISGTNRMTQ
jgi:hypothetical protein